MDTSEIGWLILGGGLGGIVTNLGWHGMEWLSKKIKEFRLMRKIKTCYSRFIHKDELMRKQAIFDFYNLVHFDLTIDRFMALTKTIFSGNQMGNSLGMKLSNHYTSLRCKNENLDFNFNRDQITIYEYDTIKWNNVWLKDSPNQNDVNFYERVKKALFNS